MSLEQNLIKMKKIILAFFMVFLVSLVVYAGEKCEGTDRYPCSVGGECGFETQCTNESDPSTCSTSYSCEGLCFDTDSTLNYQVTCTVDFDYVSGDYSTIPLDSVIDLPADKVDVTKLSDEQKTYLSKDQLVYSDNLEKIDDLSFLNHTSLESAIKEKFNLDVIANLDLENLGAGSTITVDGIITNGNISLDLGKITGEQNSVSIMALSESDGGGFLISGAGTFSLEGIDGIFTLGDSALSVNDEGMLILGAGSTYTSGNAKVTVTSQQEWAVLYLEDYDAFTDMGNTPGIYIGDSSLAFVGTEGEGTLTVSSGDVIGITATNGFSGTDVIKVGEEDGEITGVYNVNNGEAEVSFPGQFVTFKNGKYYECATDDSCPLGDSDISMTFYNINGEEVFSVDENGISTENINGGGSGGGGSGSGGGSGGGTGGVCGESSDEPPYDYGDYEVTFDWTTHRQEASGSDNWPITWADDDNQYTSWGDGGGFSGSNEDGRVSNGFAKVTGEGSSYSGYNLAGGKNAGSSAPFTGKCYGIVSVDSSLYAWRNGGASGSENYEFQELWKSTNHGSSWSSCGAKWGGDPSEFNAPTFLQFGKDNDEAIDDYVYSYAADILNAEFDVQCPGKITLMRVQKDKICDKGSYEYFSGTSSNPSWTSSIDEREPIFEDPNGCWMPSAIYNPGLDRYFIIAQHTEGLSGKIGIFDAPNPWGPWTTVLYESDWGPSGSSTAFFWNFAPKWFSSDGMDFVLVWTGIGEYDAWNTVEGNFYKFT